MKTLPLALTVASLSAALLGCATPPGDQVANAPKERCTRDAPIGTSVMVVTCRTQEQIEREQRETQRMRDSVKPGAAATSRSGG
jgi:hypothetical protein